MFRRSIAVVFIALVAVLALAGTASAAPPIRVVLGPVPVPHVPLTLCVGSSCVTTPAASSVTLDVGAGLANPVLSLHLPLVLPTVCPGGAPGLGVRVTPGAVATVVSGSLTVKLNGGSVVSLPISRTLAAGSPPLTVSACVA